MTTMTTMTRGQVSWTALKARVTGRRANLTNADLTNVLLAGVRLTGADLTGADLTRANLAYVDLTGATLTGATLTHAVLVDADLRGADLRGANLTDARLVGAHFNTEQLLDTRGLLPGGPELHQDIWDELLPANPEQRQIIEHLLHDGWDGTLREALETVGGLAGR